MPTRGPHLLQRDGRSILPVGAHFVPVQGPDWPWRVGPDAFEDAFRSMANAGLDAVRIDLLWAAVEPEEGTYDEEHLAQLDAILESARRNGLWLHPTLFIGGEVGDAFWDVPWRRDRHPHADPTMRAGQANHAAMLARRWRDHPSIIAWDLTDEPPFWLYPDTTDEDARAWTSDLVEAIRREAPETLITIGTSGQEVGWGPFRADVVAEQLDFLCVHPYPIYQPDVYPDALLSPRMTHAAAFETALASGAGRPVMVHEYGASSTQFDPEAIAAYDRLLAWSSLGRGAIGYFAWCWTDAEPAAYRRVPYVKQPHETQFGVTDWRGELRPRGRVLSELAATIRNVDLDAYASRGPAPATAAIIVPHEYVRPHDGVAYGIDEAPSGLYRPADASWGPRQGSDALPLVRSWLNAFVMTAQTHLSVAFPREALDGTWPDVPLLLMPAPLGSTTTAVCHVRTTFWDGAGDFFSNGGCLYLSCSADVAIPEMHDVLGCRIVDRAPADPPAVIRFVSRWGPFRPGDELVLPAWDGSNQTRGVRLAAAPGDVRAVDSHGDPALVVIPRATGHAVVCAYPLELLLAGVPDAHGLARGERGVYQGLAELIGARDEVTADHPAITTGMLLGARGGSATFSNHAPQPVEFTVRLPEGAVSPRLVGPDRVRPLEVSGSTALLSLDAFGATIVVWDDEPAG